MANEIGKNKIRDFLKDFPPFNLLKQEQISDIAEKAKEVFLRQGDEVFVQDGAPKDFFYVVYKGSIELLREINGEKTLIDVCDEGDVFGVRAMIAGKEYLTSAYTTESSHLIAIPCEDFRPLLKENGKVAMYFAAGFAAGQPVMRQSLIDTNEDRKDLNSKYPAVPVFSSSDVLSLQGFKRLVSCRPSASIEEVARQMNENESGFMVVMDDKNRPVGFVTDTDFRQKIGLGNIYLNAPVTEIMKSPVITISPVMPVSDIIIKMMQTNKRHLCITKDGTPDSEAMGVITERDILLIQGNSPSVLIKEIQTSKDIRLLPDFKLKAEGLMKTQLDQEVPVSFISKMVTELNDALVIKAIKHAQLLLEAEGAEIPQLDFCWLSLGSGGREEQLLRTSLDNALVYDDPAPGEEKKVHQYFVNLGKHVNQILLSCGFEKSAAEIIAGNSKWCQPLSRWKKYYNEWMYEPEQKLLMLTASIFDFRPVYGNVKLADELSENIYEQIEGQRLFLKTLAKNALFNPPPLSFFRNFIVERGGQHKDQFDIKFRAMVPLSDAARVLSFDRRLIEEKNTIRRFELLAMLEPENEVLYKEAAISYEIMLRFRTSYGLSNNNNGRYINPETLNKIERKTLRNAFNPIADLQDLLIRRFKIENQ